MAGNILRGLFRSVVGSSAPRAAVATGRNLLAPRNFLLRRQGYRQLGGNTLKSGAKNTFRNRAENAFIRGVGTAGRAGYLGYRGGRRIFNTGRNYWRNSNYGAKIRRGVKNTAEFGRRGLKSIYRKISADPASAALGVYQSTRTPTLELKLQGQDIGRIQNPQPQENIFNTRAFSGW